jgi:hypothetical protein
MADVLVMPVREPAPDAGEIAQVTPTCPGSFCTLAVSACVLPAATVAKLGLMDTVLEGTVMLA